MDFKKLKNFTKLAGELKRAGIYGLTFADEGQYQVSEGLFWKTVDSLGLEVKKETRYCDDYPYEYSANVEGVTLFCLTEHTVVFKEVMDYE